MKTSRLRRIFWLCTPLCTGALVMTLELAASRLYAPYFGFSIYVWGTLLAVVMFALAVGYALGENWEDIRAWMRPADIPVSVILVVLLAWYVIRHVRKAWEVPEPSGPEV